MDRVIDCGKNICENLDAIQYRILKFFQIAKAIICKAGGERCNHNGDWKSYSCYPHEKVQIGKGIQNRSRNLQHRDI